MPTPLLSCVHVKEVIDQSDEFKNPSRSYRGKKILI
jgi:hypothetical protein